MEPTQTPNMIPTPNPTPVLSPAKKSPTAAIISGVVVVILAIGGWYFYHAKKTAVIPAVSDISTSSTPVVDSTTQVAATDTTAPMAAPTSSSATDPDFSALVNTTLAFKAVIANKDAAGLESTQAKFSPVTADMKSELTDPNTSTLIWGLYSAVFSGITKANLDSGLTCKFDEKGPGKTYDRAAVCHVMTTLTPTADVSAFITAGSADLKLTFNKFSGTWYLNPPSNDDITMSK